eukprot:4717748-Pyramimonas_sp.AAC.2
MQPRVPPSYRSLQLRMVPYVENLVKVAPDYLSTQLMCAEKTQKTLRVGCLPTPTYRIQRTYILGTTCSGWQLLLAVIR